MADIDLSIASLLPIMNNVKVINPILQILGIKQLPSTNSWSNTEKYRLLLSDAVNTFSLASIIWPPNSERLEVYSFIKLKKYLTDHVINNSTTGYSRKVLLILELEVVAKGSLIGNAVGETVSLEKERFFISSQNHQLSAGSLWIIMDDQKVEEPIIVQVLSARRLPRSSSLPHPGGEWYRLKLSDGVNYTYWGLYQSPGEIETYSVIKLKKFITSVINRNFFRSIVNNDRKVIVILEAEVIVDGSGAGNQTIGDPKSID